MADAFAQSFILPQIFYGKKMFCPKTKNSGPYSKNIPLPPQKAFGGEIIKRHFFQPWRNIWWKAYIYLKPQQMDAIIVF